MPKSDYQAYLTFRDFPYVVLLGQIVGRFTSPRPLHEVVEFDSKEKTESKEPDVSLAITRAGCLAITWAGCNCEDLSPILLYCVRNRGRYSHSLPGYIKPSSFTNADPNSGP